MAQPAPDVEPLPAPTARRVVFDEQAVPSPAKPASPVTLVWNAWAETAAFNPLLRLTPNTEYQLVVDLSLISYLRDTPSVFHQPTSEGFGKHVDEWLNDTQIHSIPLTAVLLPEPAYFRQPSATQRAKLLTVDIDRIRKSKQEGATFDGDPFDAMRLGNPDFLIGRATFKIVTTSREGRGAVGISVWVNGNLPVDELSIPFCIATEAHAAESCADTRTVGFSLRGIDSLRVGAEGRKLPDASLHFLELDYETLMGVFRRNDWPDGRYEVWSLGRSYHEVYEQLRDTTIPAFNKQISDEALRRHGLGLYKLLFPPETAATARRELEAFVTPYLKSAANSTPPSIFIRMVQQAPDQPLLVPLGLLAVKLDTGVSEPLGFHFRIEAPLDVQTYRPSTDCISRWVLVVPPINVQQEELKNARGRIAARLDSWSGIVTAHEAMSTFANWIGDSQKDATPTALVVLSHHDHNQVFFSAGDSVTSDMIDHRFATPSVAVLDGCGTGSPGAIDFVRKLNESGVATVIATVTEVNAEMAGDFLDCLALQLDDNKTNADFNIWQAYFQAQACLQSRKPQYPVGAGPYGARVLAYTLLGNGNLRLCLPAQETP
jgi:hypothetical protein